MSPQLPPPGPLWSAFVECALDDFVVIGRDLRVRFASRPGPGQTRQDVLGQSVLNWLPADCHEEARRLMQQAWQSPAAVEVELPGRTPEGGPAWRLLRVVPVRQEGQAVALLACLRDTTPAHRAQEALPDSQARLQRQQALLAETEHLAQAGHFERGPGPGEVHVSDGLCHILGLAPGLTGLTDESFPARFVHPDDRPRLAETDQLPLERRPTQMEFRIVRPDGEVRHVRMRCRPVRDEAGKPTRVIGWMQDVTEQMQAELQGRVFQDRLHEAQKRESLGVLAGGLAHDFNNLLTTVLGYADLAEWQMPSGSPLRAYTQQIAQAARQAAGLCQQLLAYAGKTPLVHEVLDLARLVREMEPALRASLPDWARLSLVLPPSLPGVRGDPSFLRQALLELAGNAAESLGGRPGRVSVTLSSRHLDREELAWLPRGSDRPAGDYLVLEVTDDGCGMDEATRTRIFDPFFTTKFTGRGLGLAAVLGIMQAHRGAIDVRSEPGQGTTFSLFVPLACGAGEAPALVVVLNDEPGTRLVLAHMLENAAFQVAQASADAEGMGLLERLGERVRLVLLGLDWRHSGSVGVLQRLRRARPGVPLIAVGSKQERELLPHLAALADGFLSRPFGMSELLQVVRTVLR